MAACELIETPVVYVDTSLDSLLRKSPVSQTSERAFAIRTKALAVAEHDVPEAKARARNDMTFERARCNLLLLLQSSHVMRRPSSSKTLQRRVCPDLQPLGVTLGKIEIKAEKLRIGLYRHRWSGTDTASRLRGVDMP